MMKIKVEKEMKIDELIKWARENPELSFGRKYYTTDKNDENFIYFGVFKNCFKISDFILVNATFSVKVEEEVTEETKFDRLLEVYEIQEGVYKSALHKGISLNERFEDDNIFPTKAFYILNDDLTMTLIWKDGELIK
ncbi:ORF034 [Staphylococcus phage X2]|uniref:ORF034 n=2 Tax=root TaxID=1 RepID=Q4ZA42_9CAUD|nr:ORF034 [Staphylococcus phage X2]AAX92038.1 ORF034 [Staphylococcus phage X2]SCT04628.1 phage protein [Staphylococcus aureus]